MSHVFLRSEMDLKPSTVVTTPQRQTISTHQQTVVMLRTQHLDSQQLPIGIPFHIRSIDSWEEATNFFCDDQSGCLLIDFDTNREQTIAELYRIQNEWILLPIVACSSSDTGSTANTAARAGCIEFAPMPFQCDTLLQSIRRACAYDTRGDDSPRLFRNRLTTLTAREQEVLRLFLDGMNTKTIAKQLKVSYQTIDKHRNRALKKMHCGSLVDLCRALYQKQTWSF